MFDLTEAELKLVASAVEDFKEGNRCFLSYIAKDSEDIAEATKEQEMLRIILIKIHKAQKRLRKQTNTPSTRFSKDD